MRLVAQFRDHRVLQGRLIGAVVCQGALLTIAVVIFGIFLKVISAIVPGKAARSSSFSGSLVWLLVTVHLSNALAAIAHCLTLSSFERVSPIDIVVKYSPRIVSGLLIKVRGRFSTFDGGVKQVVFGLAHYVSALVILPSFSSFLQAQGSGLSSGGGALHTFLLSGAMAFVYQTHVIFWARDVLMFPNRKLHRLGRFREQVPVVLKRMVPVGGVTVIFHHVLMRVAGIGGPGILQTILNFMVVTFCLTLWSLGASLVEIIFSERLRLGDYDSKDVMDTMYECVDCQKGDLMYILALHDLSLLPSDANKAAWRRRQIFSDDSGILWNKFSSICMDILTGVILDIEKIGKDPKDYNKKKTMDASGAHGTRWNSYPATGNISKVSPWSSTEALNCLIQLACAHQMVVFSVRFLSDMAYCSADEDSYGVLQLSEPKLGDIVYTILKLGIELKNLRQYTTGKNLAQYMRWRVCGEDVYTHGRVEMVIPVLRKELDNTIDNLVSKFKDSLLDALEASSLAKSSPQRQQVISLLQSHLIT